MDQSIVVHVTEHDDVFFLEGREQAATLLDIGGTPYAVNDRGERVQLEKRDGRIVVIRHETLRAAAEGLG
ncbi:hypothetical protein RE428_42610 [Marinobacter nanhaiticus D15-8W]|uniref:Uncharacterized protein n=1 Tax=Marinobacter nanhaiticus D15-8W TaxID=626887 RepID=N6W6L1_9GAMM|nr:hypothetical protein [Marinobacter nanhaiticus]ENO15899.1 hypothetical protein J057_11121 [Marinobacter nanhaiticus D15-8W]BES73243.1 hypothetical protein RE428_42610 [Marinobacter nanhaiticus D15-8W]